MKNLAAIFLVVMLVTSCNQPQPEVHQVEIGLYTPYYMFPETLNGKVKSVVEKSFFAAEKDGVYEKGAPLTVKDRDSIGWTTNFELRYSEYGNLVYSADIDENGEEILHWDIRNENDRMTTCKLTRADTLRTMVRLSYNEAGALTNIRAFSMPADTLAYQVFLSSDENGNFTEWQMQDPAGNNTSKYIFAVNLEGKRTGYKRFNKDGEQIFEQQFTYNDKGNMTRQVLIARDGNEYVSEYEYKYDEMGNWIWNLGNSQETMILTERTITYYED